MNLTSKLKSGDLVAARIANFDRTRDPLVTIADRDLGKIDSGDLIKISPSKVPRLIGKRGTMIQAIENGHQCCSYYWSKWLGCCFM